MNPPRISRRLITHVFICLLIGAVLNVLVAWACWKYAPITAYIFPSAVLADSYSMVYSHWTTYKHRIELGVSPHIYGPKGWGFEALFWTARDREGEVLPATSYALKCGWPLHSLSKKIQLKHRIHLGGRRSFGTSLADMRQEHLPMTPRPISFAINTLFYAMLTAFVILLPRLIRGIMIRRLSYPACLSCGYNLTGNTTGACPECGAVPEVSRAA